LAGSPLLNERRQEKRWPLANKRSWKNSQDDYKGHDRIYCRGVDDSRMERTLSVEFEWEIMGLENGRQKVGGMVISPFTAATDNERRVGASQNMNMNIANCGLNHRRRGIELGSNNSDNHRKIT
jgi:hypothetical protein